MLLLRKTPGGGGCFDNCRQQKHFYGVDNQINKLDEYHVTENGNSRDSADDVQFNGGYSATFRNIEEQLVSIHRLINNVVRHQKDKERTARFREKIEHEWRFLAVILDRLFFITYLLVIVVSLVLLFPRVHH